MEPRPARMANRRRFHRRGIATFWIVLWLPVLLVMFCVVVNIGTIWLARVELENSLESTALAAVKEWGDQRGGSTVPARRVGVSYARNNMIRQQPLQILANYDPSAGDDNPNENRFCRPVQGGHLVFGSVSGLRTAGPVVFQANVAPSEDDDEDRVYAVRAQITVPVRLLCGRLCGFGMLQERCVSAKATAVYDCRTRRVRLIRVDQFRCQ